MLKKSLSQHLIKDRNLLEKIVRLGRITEDDTVVEIGAGQGDLTKCIAQKAGRLYAIEIDKSFKHYLDSVEQAHNNVKVVYGDILQIPLAQFSKQNRIKIVGNIPYKITGPILIKILKERAVVSGAFLTMQREVALRVASQPHHKTYGTISVSCQILADVKMLLYIKPEAFIPPPRVGSALLSIIPKEEETQTDEGLIGFVRSCFQNKRKHLKYALTKLVGTEKTALLYSYMGFRHEVRAEEIEAMKFKEIYHFLKELGR